MTTPHRTLQMALDALDAITDDVDGTGLNTMPSFDKALDAIAALREALNAPEPEPVAEVYRARYGRRARYIGVNDVRKLDGVALPPLGTKLYAAPPAAPDHLRDVAGNVAPAASVVSQPARRTADCLMCGHCAATGERVAAPVVREPLTGDQLWNLWRLRGETPQFIDFVPIVRSIERAHGITGASK